MQLAYCPNCRNQIAAASPQCSYCGYQVAMASPLAEATVVYDSGEVPLAAPVEYVDEIVDAGEYIEDQLEYAEAVAESDAEYYEPPARRVPYEFFFFLTILVVVLFIGGSIVAFLLYSQRGGNWSTAGGKNSSSHTFVSTSNQQSDEPHDWLRVGEGAILLGKTQVQVMRAEWGEARGKDEYGAVVISDEQYLQIIVRVENNSSEPIHYRSWYGNEFPTDDGVLRVELHDQLQRDIPWKVFEEFERVRWHLPEATIEPWKMIEDVIIFQLPPDVDPATVEYVRLSLPAAALGREGFYYFELPRDMIEDF